MRVGWVVFSMLTITTVAPLHGQSTSDYPSTEYVGSFEIRWRRIPITDEDITGMATRAIENRSRVESVTLAFQCQGDAFGVMLFGLWLGPENAVRYRFDRATPGPERTWRVNRTGRIAVAPLGLTESIIRQASLAEEIVLETRDSLGELQYWRFSLSGFVDAFRMLPCKQAQELVDESLVSGV
jgi:hypothetical protein